MFLICSAVSFLPFTTATTASGCDLRLLLAWACAATGVAAPKHLSRPELLRKSISFL